MELADMPVLETGSKECRFNSCHPHHSIKRKQKVILNGDFLFSLFNIKEFTKKNKCVIIL